MSGTVATLIGQIIDPQPGALLNPAPISPMRANAPLPELIGRILSAPDDRSGVRPVTPVPLVAQEIATAAEASLKPTDR